MNDEDAPELTPKPCPWCGHEKPKADFFAKAPHYQVRCRRMECTARAARGNTIDLAITYWNQIQRKELLA